MLGLPIRDGDDPNSSADANTLQAQFGDFLVNNQADFEKVFGTAYGDFSTEFPNSSSPFTITGKSGSKIPIGTRIILMPIKGTTGDSLASGGAGIGDDGTNTWDGRPAYVLKNAIQLSNFVTIIGTGNPNVIKDDSSANEDDIKFYTEETGTGQQTVTGVATDTFTVGDDDYVAEWNESDDSGYVRW